MPPFEAGQQFSRDAARLRNVYLLQAKLLASCRHLAAQFLKSNQAQVSGSDMLQLLIYTSSEASEIQVFSIRFRCLKK
ncbi:hypothetical protein [Stenotrophomonas indicatrix]|uniref:hypothetical protein n=1 Tax=Stenotrophomonas indicatrix TaxID=2045451 RepID=UPI002166126A|nr:hypothetical protein [Stenotrophomonas indicatrix]